MRACLGLTVVLVLGLAASGRSEAQPAKWAETYAAAVRKVNEAHARRPEKTTEDELGKRLAKPARAALDRLVKYRGEKGLEAALETAGEAALDLALLDDFERVRARLLAVSPDAAERLGTAHARPRFLLRGIGGLDQKYLENFAALLDAVLDTYHAIFGFEEWSKVRGKRIRVRIRLVDRITRPPFFDPSPRFHSEINFPVIDPEELSSPTRDGKFLFYGLCHELGHLIAMWGDPKTMEDHHAWAHYTGVVICEALSKKKGKKRPFMKKLRDARRRSLAIERKQHEKIAPSVADRAGVLALLIRLHDAVGPRAVGGALNLMDAKRMGHRNNHVRYYGFRDFRKALLKVVKGRNGKAKVKKLLPG